MDQSERNRHLNTVISNLERMPDGDLVNLSNRMSSNGVAVESSGKISDESILKASRLREYGETERYTLDNFDDAMKYQPWNKPQTEAGDIVREALTTAGKAILRVVPPSRFRDKVLDGIVQARMDANAAISFKGRF